MIPLIPDPGNAGEGRPRMISVRINGNEKEIGGSQTVLDLLELLKIKNPAVAVAINDEIVPRSEIKTRQVCEGDRIELIQAVGGG